MDHTKHLGRCVAAGIGALVLSGAGIASATTPTDDTTMDTTMTMDSGMGASSEPMAGGGPSDCPAIPAAAAEAPATSDASMSTAADEMSATTEAADMASVSSTPTGSDAPVDTTGDTTVSSDSMVPMSGPIVQIAESDEHGPILVDGNCRTLYVFSQDVDGEATCLDGCAEAWPPLLSPDESVPALADELDPALFSTVEHPEGTQLKVGDWPLYYFAADAAPGDINGQGVGGVWWLVSSDGMPIEDAAGTESSAPAASMPTDTVSMTTTG